MRSRAFDDACQRLSNKITPSARMIVLLCHLPVCHLDMYVHPHPSLTHTHTHWRSHISVKRARSAPSSPSPHARQALSVMAASDSQSLFSSGHFIREHVPLKKSWNQVGTPPGSPADFSEKKFSGEFIMSSNRDQRRRLPLSFHCFLLDQSRNAFVITGDFFYDRVALPAGRAPPPSADFDAAKQSNSAWRTFQRGEIVVARCRNGNEK